MQRERRVVDDQKVQPCLQNAMFEDEVEAEELDKGVDINFLRDKEGLIHLTQAEYEDFMSYTQNTEVVLIIPWFHLIIESDII